MKQETIINRLAGALRATIKTYPYKRCEGKCICDGCKAQIRAEKALALLDSKGE